MSVQKVVLIFLFFTEVLHSRAFMDPILVSYLHSRSKAPIKVIALLKYSSNNVININNRQRPRKYDPYQVNTYLRTLNKDSLHLFMKDCCLNSSNSVGGNRFLNSAEFKVLANLWISNALILETTSHGLQNLSNFESVDKIYANRTVSFEKSVVSVAPVNSEESVPRLYSNLLSNSTPNLVSKLAINSYLNSILNLNTNVNTRFNFKSIFLDKVISEFPNLQGQGVKIGIVDSGVDGKHFDLQGKVILFYDALNNKITDSFDRTEHGTHVAGIMVGGNRENQNIGIAPLAKLVVAATPKEDFSTVLLAMQFLIDPDNNPKTADFPRIVNNSWNAQSAPDVELFYRAISAWEAMGILPIFSAGNSGPQPQTITRPHEHPSVITVGATDEFDRIADFSSRGPGVFHGMPLEKPELTAPGVNVISSVPGGQLKAMSGTSMASPHVTGVAALLLQLNPLFTPRQLKEIIVRSVTPVGIDGSPITTPAWNANYGFGKLNAYQAIKMGMKK